MRLESQTSQVQQPSEVRLSASEMDAVLNRAIARESDAKKIEPRDATLEDAVEIARELGISEEQVRASLAEVRAETMKSARREEKRALVRSRRRRAAGVAIGAAALVTAGLLLKSAGAGVISAGWLAILAGWAYAGWLIFRARFAPVLDAEADRAELMPVAGVCRVCGETAYSPQSTFCQEHRYHGPQP